MALIYLALILSTICCVAALKIYTTIVLKFPVPLSDEHSKRVLTMWLLLTIVLIATLGIPAKIIEGQGDPVPRPYAILPLVIGSIISGVVFKKDWVKFLQHFNVKKD